MSTHPERTTSGAPHTQGFAYLFHRGALGDSILLWPLLRSLVALYGRAAFVTDGSKARLAARFIPGVDPIDAEQPRFNAMFAPSPYPTRDFRPVHASRVLCFLFGDVNETSIAWERNARAMFPDVSIEMIYERPDAILARRLAPNHLCGTSRGDRYGPIIIHIGAGSPLKRWPLDTWRHIEASVTTHELLFIAGEAEAGAVTSCSWSPKQSQRGWALIDSLDELASELVDARGFVGFDTGPTHLAAQLGLPTLALFGPSDPARWKPIGPLVRVLAPARHTTDMSWLSPDVVARAIAEM